MASIYQRKSGNRLVWCVQYRVKGKRYSRVVGESKKEAEAILRDLKRKLAARDPVLDAKERRRSQITVSDYFSRKYLDWSEANKKPGGYERDQTIVKFLLAFLEERGYRWLPDVDPLALEDYKIHLRKRGSVENANRHLHTIRHSFGLAVHLGYLRDSPMKMVKDLKPGEGKPPRFFSVPELREILWAALIWPYTGDKGHQRRIPHKEGFYRCVLFLASTGARIGELEQISWEHIHLSKGFVRLPTLKGQGRVEWRNVPLTENLAWALKRAKKNREPVADTLDARRRLQGILRALGIPHANVHTLRHTFASHLAMKGVSLYVIGSLLGHSNPQTTAVYSHLSPSSLEVVSLLPY